MRNRDLTTILETLAPKAKIAIEVKDIAAGEQLAETCDLRYTILESEKLKSLITDIDLRLSINDGRIITNGTY